MRGAFIALTIGSILIYSGLKNLSIIEVLRGEKGESLDPSKATIDASEGASANRSTRTVTAGLEAMVAECNRMIGLKQPYKWGGGHADFDPDGPWDCSGAVSWILHYVGLYERSAPTNSTGFMREGERGKGRLFTIYASPGHVFLQFEAGSRKGWSWGTTSRIASQGGSLKWHHHTTAGFVARHYAGF